MTDNSDEEFAGGRTTRRRILRRAATVPRELLRIVYRDPEHACERMTLFASGRLAEPAREWAQAARAGRPAADPQEIAADLGVQSRRIAGIEGAVAGTPFYVALIPGYMNYLWQEIRMTLRLAALYGRDPSALRTAAEVLSLRGVYPSVEAAHDGLLAVRAAGMPPKPTSRRSPRVWLRSIRRILIFGGFLSPSTGTGHHGLRSWLRDAIGVIAGAGVWVFTWFFPASFMIAMAWGCHSHARRLFAAAARYYAGETTPPATGLHVNIRARRVSKREVAHGGAFVLSLVLPIAFLAYATRVRDHAGLNLISGLGVLVAMSLVLAAVVYGRR